MGQAHQKRRAVLIVEAQANPDSTRPHPLPHLVTNVPGSPVRWLGQGPPPPGGTGFFSIVGNTITMEAIGGGKAGGESNRSWTRTIYFCPTQRISGRTP